MPRTARCSRFPLLGGASAKFETSENSNADQSVQFTGAEFIAVLKGQQIHIYMDGTGLWRGNVYIESLWQSLKYKEVYLHAYDSVVVARSGIVRYLASFDARQSRTALDRCTPDIVNFDSLPFAG